MKEDNDLSLKEIKRWLRYDAESGELYWIKTTTNRVKVGDIAGYKRGRYVQVSLLGRRYFGHILCYALYHGYFPKGEIDHIDQDTHNNRPYNLRDVSSVINAKNKPKRRDNRSGVSGVSWDKINKKWVVRIKDNGGKYVNRGRFTSLSEAKQARDTAAYGFGYHKNHGRFLSRQQYRSI